MYFCLKGKKEVKSSLLGTYNKRHKGKLQFWYILELEGHKGIETRVATFVDRYKMSQ